MKRILFLLTVLCLTLCSCSKDDSKPENESYKVSFVFDEVENLSMNIKYQIREYNELSEQIDIHTDSFSGWQHSASFNKHKSSVKFVIYLELKGTNKQTGKSVTKSGYVSVVYYFKDIDGQVTITGDTTVSATNPVK